MARTETNTLNSTKHAKQQDVADIQNKLVLCVLDFLFFISDFLKMN